METKQHATKKKKKKRKERVKEEIRKYLKTIKSQKNKSTTFQIIQDTAKAVLRGKFILIHDHLKEKKKSQINHLNYHINKLGEEKQTKLKVSRKKT